MVSVALPGAGRSAAKGATRNVPGALATVFT